MEEGPTGAMGGRYDHETAFRESDRARSLRRGSQHISGIDRWKYFRSGVGLFSGGRPDAARSPEHGDGRRAPEQKLEAFIAAGLIDDSNCEIRFRAFNYDRATCHPRIQ